MQLDKKNRDPCQVCMYWLLIRGSMQAIDEEIGQVKDIGSGISMCGRRSE